MAYATADGAFSAIELEGLIIYGARDDNDVFRATNYAKIITVICSLVLLYYGVDTEAPVLALLDRIQVLFLQ